MTLLSTEYVDGPSIRCSELLPPPLFPPDQSILPLEFGIAFIAQLGTELILADQSTLPAEFRPVAGLSVDLPVTSFAQDLEV